MIFCRHSVADRKHLSRTREYLCKGEEEGKTGIRLGTLIPRSLATHTCPTGDFSTVLHYVAK